MSLQTFDVGDPKVLLEREGVLERVGAASARLKLGSGCALFVVGEAGLGKTSILRRAISDAAMSGIRVGFGEGVASESRLGFGLLQQTWKQLGSDGWIGGSESRPFADLRTAPFYWFMNWLEEQANSAPVMIAIDDLHWADPDSLALLAYACRRLRDLNVLVMATLRPWPREAFDAVAELYATGHVEVEQVRPLSFEAGSKLIMEAAGECSVPEGELRGIWDACAGNPLLLENAGAAFSDGTAKPGAGEVVGLPSRAFRSRVLLLRFAGLADQVLRTAQAASIFGTRFRTQLVAEIAGVDPSEAAESLRVLTNAGLVLHVGDGWSEFVHPLFRMALYDDIAEPTRANLHAVALRVLRRFGADPTEAAVHARRGNLVGDEVALAVLRDATRVSLASGGIGTSLVHLRTAVELAGASDSVGLRLSLSEVLVAAGQFAEAEAIGQDLLLVDLSAEVRSKVLSCLAQAALWSGEPGKAEMRFDDAIEAVADKPDLAVNAILEACRACLPVSNARRLLGWSQRARELAGGKVAREGTVSAGRLAETEIVWAQCAVMCGDSQGIAAADSAGRRAGSMQGRDAEAMRMGMWAGFSAFAIAKATERFSFAHEVFTALFAEAERMASPVAIVSLAMSYADVLARVGRLREAAELVERASVAAELVPLVLPWVRVARAHIGRERGTEYTEFGDAAAIAACDAVEALANGFPDHGPTLRLWLLKLRIGIEMDAGRPSDACRLARTVEDKAQHFGLMEPCVVPWADTALEAYIAADARDDVVRLLDSVRRASDGWPCIWPRSVVLSGEAWLAEISGERGVAEGHHRETIEMLREVELPLVRATALVSFGAFLRRGGEPRRARSVVAEAIEIAEECGAGRIGRMARVELAACGGRRRRSLSERWELTAREAVVAGIAAEGASNIEIASILGVSPKTVEHHLHSVYLKLGMSSRRELIRGWSTRDGDGKRSPGPQVGSVVAVDAGRI
ncbi:MAG: LuxR C-terminal-related transcriptional regulator [Actinomycetota bacterium]|nr:LuxR C-terminal-related transcriptional regulator [Actinomycetota bacterium]